MKYIPLEESIDYWTGGTLKLVAKLGFTKLLKLCLFIYLFILIFIQYQIVFMKF